MSQNSLLEEAVRIGEDILSQGIESNQGIGWKTMVPDHEHLTWEASESIYNGVGGIVLFFIELYKQSMDEKYLQSAIKGADWLINHVKNNQTSNYAFFTGRMGLTYVFSQLCRLTKEDKYLNEAVQISLNCLSFLEENRTDDLINGSSGILLGLILLHQESGEERLLPLIERFTENLVQKSHHGHIGLYWDKSPSQMRGLCGFSHGSSGVGYVFLQLGYYFNNPSFYWLAEQAFAYENHFFDEQTKNWPDFRKGVFSENDFEEHKQAYINRDFDFFFKPGNLMAWCHGAPGIGLSRIPAWQLLKKEYLKKDVKRSLLSTGQSTLSILTESDTFTLCHGKGGNAMLFIDAYKQLGDKEAYNLAKRVAFQALDFRDRYGYYIPGYRAANGQEDISLFMGNAGVGYFYLMCNEPDKVPFILAPRTDGECKTDYSFNKDLNIPLFQLKKRILTKVYPKTIAFIENNESELDLHSIFEKSDRIDIKSNFIHQIDNLISKNGREIADLSAFETIKLNVELNTNSSYQYIKSAVLREQAESILSLSKKRLLNTTLTLNDSAILYYGRGNGYEHSESPAILLLKNSVKVKVFNISKFTLEMLKAFTKPILCYQVVNILLEELDSNNKEEKNKAEKLILDQVHECIRALFLIKI